MCKNLIFKTPSFKMDQRARYLNQIAENLGSAYKLPKFGIDRSTQLWELARTIFLNKTSGDNLSSHQ